jgi:isocitrate dehydrogenase
MGRAITVAHGDGIGPEIMEVALRILCEGGAQLEIEAVEVGERVYRAGNTAGVGEEVWASLRRTGVFLKAPITTPQGGGFKSLNVTVRKTLGLYANVRPCVAYAPFVRTRHPKMDVVIVRENEEDLYAGIEHRQTTQVMQCLKLITLPGCEKIVRYAFEYARRHGRRKVTCFTKDNIMKMTDGLFHRVFDTIAPEYQDIASDHMIVDIGAARLADTPEAFDVIVMPNLYGDILSDVAAQIAGSIGLAGTANIGARCAMFEAIHGSAPDIAGRDLANPSGLLLSAVMMLVHIGQPEAASRIHNAWLATLEAGVHTGDIFTEEGSRERVGTRAFADAVISRLGQEPSRFAPVRYALTDADALSGLEALEGEMRRKTQAPAPKKDIVGVDIFLEWHGATPEELGARLSRVEASGLALSMITNRGVKVWPKGHAETFCTDHWRTRFVAGSANGGTATHRQILDLYSNLVKEGFDVIKTENLCTFDGQPGYSLGQGQ